MQNDNGGSIYETPVLMVHGTLEEMTQNTSSGSKFDMSFNAGDTAPNPLDILFS